MRKIASLLLGAALLLCAAPRLRAGESAFEIRAVAPRLGLPGTTEQTLDDGGGDPVKLPLGSEVLLDASALVSAEAKNEDGVWFIAVELNATGKARLAEITAHFEGRRLAILINGVVRCAPLVNAPITDGSFEISGAFTSQEVKGLAADLNAAAGGRQEPTPTASATPAATATPSNP